MSELKLKAGDVVNFSLPRGAARDHVAKVEIITACYSSDAPLRLFYTCRRVDNGSVVLAWAEDLKP